jgi:hypothetical protein
MVLSLRTTARRVPANTHSCVTQKANLRFGMSESMSAPGSHAWKTHPTISFARLDDKHPDTHSNDRTCRIFADL